jgi:hypothetical protein
VPWACPRLTKNIVASIASATIESFFIIAPK